AMIYLIKDTYHIKNLTEKVANFIEYCKICQLAYKNKKTKEISPIKVQHFNELWEIDLIGPLYNKDLEIRYIVTLIDMFTKKAHARIIQNKSTGQIIQIVDENIKKYGCRAIIL
ncbi:hypothetical protein COBT_004068, partial [Conglomerata obtusa]